MIKKIILSIGLIITLSNTAMLYDEDEAKGVAPYEMQQTKPLTAQTMHNKTTLPQSKPSREGCCLPFLKILEKHFSTPSRKPSRYIQG